MSNSKKMEAAVAMQVRVELTERRMTQKDLAEAIGTGPDVINRYLQGHRSMNVRTHIKIAEALGIAPSLLLERAGRRLKADPNIGFPQDSDD